MENILFINTCVRENSRTRRLASRVLQHLNGKITEICPDEEHIRPLDREWLQERTKLTSAGNFSHPDFRLARQFADADEIVIGAPFWDLTFPASLKEYIEAINLVGITFAYADDGSIQHLCRAKQLYYITTAGGALGRNMGYDYIKALCDEFYGIPSICFAAEKLDLPDADIEKILENAEHNIDTYFSSH